MQLLPYYCILFVYVDNAVADKNGTKACSMWWMEWRNSTRRCTSEIDGQFTCDGENSCKLEETFCLSYDNISQLLLAARCPYSYYQQDYLRNLNSSVTPDELNEMMCGPLNRQGLFCSKCKPGYGIPVFSKVVDECVKCDSRFAWPLYLALVLIPITVFYIVVIIFNFSATRPPITAYIFYCQLFGQIVSPHNIHFLRHSFEANSNHAFLYLTWTVCDIWNLDILRYVIPGFCLSEGFTNIGALFLELVTAFYPPFLIIITVILIEMHASNFKVVVFLWKPFHKCFSSFRRTWDPKSSVINAFATFLLLSSFKVCFSAFTFFYSIKIHSQDDSVTVLYIEPNVKLIDCYKQPYFIPLILIFLSFVIVPMFLLSLYPTKCWKIACRRICSARQRNAIFLFMDAFQGHYKDGTGGTYDYRSASCIGFVIRFVACASFVFGKSKGYSSYVAERILPAFITASLFYALIQPCRKQYMNVVEALLYSTAAVLLVYTESLKLWYTNYLLVVILAPSVVFVCAIAYKLLGVLGILHQIKGIIVKIKFGWSHNENESPEAEPHRLTHPTQYTPLLQ